MCQGALLFLCFCFFCLTFPLNIEFRQPLCNLELHILYLCGSLPHISPCFLHHSSITNIFYLLYLGPETIALSRHQSFSAPKETHVLLAASSWVGTAFCPSLALHVVFPLTSFRFPGMLTKLLSSVLQFTLIQLPALATTYLESIFWQK